jgi:drug/metabolite transporter (DMT)-like permease
MWLLLALLTAAATAGRSAAAKRAMRGVDEYTVAFALSGAAAVLLAPLVAARGVPPVSTAFWLALLGSGSVNTVSLVLIARAVHRSELSLVAPLLSFTPVFMLLSAPLLLGEWPTGAGLAGLLAIVAGSYLLNVGERRRGLLMPFRVLVRDSGARLMLLVSFIFSLSATLDKVGVLASDPVTWGFALQLYVSVTVLPFVVWAARRGRGRAPRWPNLPPLEPHGGLAGPADVPAARPSVAGAAAPITAGAAAGVLLLGGVLTAGAVLAQMTALTMTLAAYVIAVKRTSILFEVLLGHLVFRERGLRERLAGVVVMIAGVLLITLG